LAARLSVAVNPPQPFCCVNPADRAGPGLILLVEDNLRDIELTLATLKRNHVANEIVVARHGGEALDYLYGRGRFQPRPAGNPVVVLLDLKMPKVDGMEVLRQMKSDPALKLIPVVAEESVGCNTLWPMECSGKAQRRRRFG
jgi:CheY-like chemotaxis protein